MKFYYWISTLLCTALFAIPSLAEEPIEKKLPWYEVEVIIFTRDLYSISFNEVWPAAPGMPDFANAQPLQPEFVADIQPAETVNVLDVENPGGATPSTSAASAIDTLNMPVPVRQRLPVPYTLIPEDEYRLTTEFARLQKNKDLQPVIHLAWRQPVTDLNDAKLLYLRTPELPVEEETIRGFERFAITEPISLEGTIRVSVNRYLHVEFDLLRRRKQSAPYSSYEQSFGDSLIPKSQAYSLYRMQDMRRMRSGELHYIDHPLMGVLIKITPYELPEPTPITPVESEATDRSITEPTTRVEGGAVTESSAAAIAEPEAESSSQAPGITTSVVELPARSAE